MGFKGSRKSTPMPRRGGFAAEDVSKKAHRKHGMRTPEVEVAGSRFGPRNIRRFAADAGGGLHRHVDPRRDDDPA